MDAAVRPFTDADYPALVRLQNRVEPDERRTEGVRRVLGPLSASQGTPRGIRANQGSTLPER